MALRLGRRILPPASTGASRLETPRSSRFRQMGFPVADRREIHGPNIDPAGRVNAYIVIALEIDFEMNSCR